MKLTKLAAQPLEQGQVWGFEDTRIQIGQVGKRLIHFKRFKGERKSGIVNDLTGIESMQTYLKDNKAKLLETIVKKA